MRCLNNENNGCVYMIFLWASVYAVDVKYCKNIYVFFLMNTCVNKLFGN